MLYDKISLVIFLTLYSTVAKKCYLVQYDYTKQTGTTKQLYSKITIDQPASLNGCTERLN